MGGVTTYMKFVFFSFPDCSDNVFYMFYQMKRAQIEGEYIWLYAYELDKDLLNAKFKRYFHHTIDNNVKFVKKNSLKGIWHYMTSDYSFNSHGMFEKLPRKKKNVKVNLWHGMPLKKIGKLIDTEFHVDMDYTISTAPVFNEIIRDVFGASDNQVISVGQPRNDAFFSNVNFSFTEVFNNDNKTIVWLPTYRKSSTSYIRQDGEFVHGEIGGLSLEDMKKIDDYLGEKEINLAVKLHPMDALNNGDSVYSFQRIVIMNNDYFKKLSVEINDVLKSSSSLITDYSSVYFDYLLLNKPIGIMSLDEESYNKSRGYVSAEVKDKFSGFQINSLESFLNFVDFTIENPTFLHLQREFFNEYDKNGTNSLEILRKIGLI